MKQVTVYTALCGPKSVVQKPEWIGPNVDYVCFTDQQDPPHPWQSRALERCSPDPCRSAKRYKLLPHVVLPDRDVTIWVDANFRITRGFDELLPMLDETPIILFQHFERNCIYDEAVACLHAGLDDPDVIERQMQRYRRSGFPTGYGLAECGTILRRNTADVRELMERWWSEITRGSRRDQLSFMYCVWESGLREKVRILYRTARDGHYHEWTPHINMRPLEVER